MSALLKNMNRAQRNRPRPQNNLCETCHTKPKFMENGYLHQYCSRSCARSGTGEKPMPCILEGCQSTGRPEFSYYCSKEHGKEAVHRGNVPACEGCKVYSQYQSIFCKECLHDTEAYPALALKELSSDDTTFKQVRDEFRSMWRSESDATMPTVEKIYEIPISRQMKTRQKKFSKTMQHPGEIRTYFSSMCVCDMGVDAATTCKEKTCGVCNAIRSSFECLGFGSPYHIGRYGKGIYSYVNPSHSDQFTYTVTTSPYRTSIACTAIVDRKHEIPENSPVFVSSADGIIPAFVIMFFK